MSAAMENHSALLSVVDDDINNNDPIVADKNDNDNTDKNIDKVDKNKANDHNTDQKEKTGNGTFHSISITNDRSNDRSNNIEHDSYLDSSFHYKHILYNIWRKFIWLPPFVSACIIPVTVVGLYLWAVVNNQVEPFLPYISEVGTLPPQAAFFSMFLDIYAMLCALTFLIRYKQLKHELKQIPYEKRNFLQILHGINWLSVGSGYAHCGLVIFIGNFRAQEWQLAHLLAAICGFFTFLVYSIGSTYVTEYVHRSGQESSPVTMKAAILLMILSMTGAFSTLLVSFWIVGKEVYDPAMAFKWHSEGMGDLIHDVSALFQWAIFHSIALYLLCLSRRMYHFRAWDKVKLTQ